MTTGERFPLILKLVVFCMSGEFVRIFSKSPVLFGLGFIVGSLLQIAIPPRKVGWRPMLAVSVGFTIIALLWTRGVIAR